MREGHKRRRDSDKGRVSEHKPMELILSRFDHGLSTGSGDGLNCSWSFLLAPLAKISRSRRRDYWKEEGKKRCGAYCDALA